MKKDKHLVIGGNGFLGRILVKKLIEQNKKVKVIDKDAIEKDIKIEFLHKNILDFSEKDNEFFKDVEVVYHLASYQYHSELPIFNQYKVFYKNNVEGTRKVIDICKINKITKIIYVSTDMVYGIPKKLPILETDNKTPIGDYGKTKLIAEEIIKNSALNYIIIRPRLIIGAGRLGVFKVLFNWIKKNQPVFLIGNGKNRYQMISVYDCADACILAANKKIENKIYNIGSDNPPTVYEMMKEVIRINKSKSKIYRLNSTIVITCLKLLELFHISPLKKEQYMISNKDCILDTSKVKKELNWKPKFNDLQMVIEGYRSFNKKL